MTERQLPPASHFSVFRSAAKENVERTEAVASANDGSSGSPVPGLDWGLVLSVTMMRTLEYRLPGFTADVESVFSKTWSGWRAVPMPSRMLTRQACTIY
jgi:hypothetical protein